MAVPDVERPAVPATTCDRNQVLVIGGGAIGLTTAIRLLEAGCAVTIVAASFEKTCSHTAASWHIPDPLQYGTGHGSTAAGFRGERYARWARRTFEVMQRDAGNGDKVIQLLKGVRLYTEAGAPAGMGPIKSGATSIGTFLPDFKELGPGDAEWNAVDVESGMRALGERHQLLGGTTFSTVTTDMTR